MNSPGRADPRAELDLADGLYNQGVTASIISAVIGAVIVGVMWNRVPHAILEGWYALILTNQAIRVLLVRAFGIARPQMTNPGRWLRRYAWTMAAGGAIFGTGAAVLFPTGEPLAQAFLVVMVFGLASGALSANAYYRPALLAHLFLMLVPMILRLAYEGGFEYGALTFTTAFGLLVTLAFGLRQSAILRDSISVRFQNVDLIEELKYKTALAEAAQLRAEHANLAKSQFFAAASHDLRQPLQSLGLFAALLRENEPAADKERRIDQILGSIDALESLFDELLDISKLDAGYVKPSLTHFPAEVLFERLHNTYSPIARKAGLALQFDDAGAILFSDLVLLERVLGNLVSNALRYTTEGSVDLRCRPGAQSCVMEVADTGPGIPSEQHERVFDEFYQLGNSERDRRKGLGLGLATVKRIGQLLGHRITLDSEPGKGAVFAIEVPLGDPAQVVPAAAAPTAASVDTLQGKVIAILDDERDVREGLTELLGTWHCITVASASTSDLLARLAQERLRPDAVIADFRLREHENGMAGVAALRAHYGETLPALIMSGDTTEAIFRMARERGLPLLSKPVKAAHLRAALQHLLSAVNQPA